MVLPQNMPKDSKAHKVRGAHYCMHACRLCINRCMLPFVYQPILTYSACASCDIVCGCGRHGTSKAQFFPRTKYQKKMVPVTAYKLTTGGALQTIGEFDNQAEASAAAGIPGGLQKTGSRYTMRHAVRCQLQGPAPQRSSLPRPLPLLQGDPITLSTRSKLSVPRPMSTSKRSLPSAVLQQPGRG
jgi:hypothetical protein